MHLMAVKLVSDGKSVELHWPKGGRFIHYPSFLWSLSSCEDNTHRKLNETFSILPSSATLPFRSELGAAKCQWSELDDWLCLTGN